MIAEKKLKIVCTGVAGFIGSHLARKLLSEGHEVIGVDNLSCGFRKNVEDLMSNVNFKFNTCDICDYKGMLKFVKYHTLDVDLVYHLSARGETWLCKEKPDVAVLVNVIGTINVLKLARDLKCKHFVFADTSAEYDGFPVNDENYPSTENMAPIASDFGELYSPMGNYSITKMAAAAFVRSMGKEFGFSTTLFRPFNVYGPAVNIKRDIPPVIGAFIVKLLKNEQPIIYGDGSKRRDFIYISDMIELLYRVIEYRLDKKDTQTFNAGTGDNYSVNEIYEIISEQLFGPTPPNVWIAPQYEGNKSYEAQVTLADISKTRRYFSWSPKIGIEEGIAKTIESIRKLVLNS